MNASADIQTKTHTNALSVPINAVTTRNKKGDVKEDKKDKKGDDDNDNEQGNVPVSGSADDDMDEVVFVLNADKTTVKKVKVKTDIQDINYIEITNGVKAGDEVITGPYNVVSKTLKEGNKVKVVKKEDLFDDK